MKPPRAARALRVLFTVLSGLALAIALIFGAPRAAFAAPDGIDPVATPPRDVPIVLQPSSVHVPPVPPTYQTKDLGWLKISYLPGAYERVKPLIAGAEEFKAKLADELGQPILDHVEVRVARTPEEMAALAPAELPPFAYASGIAYPPLHLVLLTLVAPRTYEGTDLDEVFRHELTHIALEDAVAGHHVPRWFNEGYAIHESGEHRFDRTKTLWDATLSRTVLPLSELDRGFPSDNYEVSIAYAESADFVRFLARKSDTERFSALVERVRGGQAFDPALADAYGSDMRKLEFQWREELSKRYTYLPVLTGGSFLWVLVAAALVLGYMRRRRRAKETLARWEREEAAANAIRRAKALAVTPDEETRIEFESRPPPGLPKVEHDGGWHTVH